MTIKATFTAEPGFAMAWGFVDVEKRPVPLEK